MSVITIAATVSTHACRRMVWRLLKHLYSQTTSTAMSTFDCCTTTICCQYGCENNNTSPSTATTTTYCYLVAPTHYIFQVTAPAPSEWLPDICLPQHPGFHDNNFRSEGCTDCHVVLHKIDPCKLTNLVAPGKN